MVFRNQVVACSDLKFSNLDFHAEQSKVKSEARGRRLGLFLSIGPRPHLPFLGQLEEVPGWKTEREAKGYKFTEIRSSTAVRVGGHVPGGTLSKSIKHEETKRFPTDALAQTWEMPGSSQMRT